MRQILMVAFEQAQMLDVVGPLEVFSVASRVLEHTKPGTQDGYGLRLCALQAGPVGMSNGLSLIAPASLSRLRQAPDTLMVAGGQGSRVAMDDPRMRRGLARLSPRSRRTASVCTGALCLAAAGLLEGRRATTHWASCRLLAERFPNVQVEADAIYVRDANLWSSAGVTAGMDLALAMVEADHGAKLALQVARQLVMFVKRPGGQSQFSATLQAQQAERSELSQAGSFVTQNLAADLSVPGLAQRFGMSPRNFARLFARELGEPPGRFVERARTEAARRLLEEGEADLEQIAVRCGFGSAETMRRTFQRRLKVAPRRYREHFRPQPNRETAP